MLAECLPEDLRSLSAQQLAARLFGAARDADAAPFWADGGTVQASFRPGGHTLTALPSGQGRLQVDALPFGGLGAWLRSHAGVSGGGNELRIVGLAYDAGRSIERIPALARQDPELPDVVWASYPAYIQNASPEGEFTLHAQSAQAARALIALLRTPHSGGSVRFPEGLSEEMPWERYCQGVNEVLSAISAGDVYQVNVARRLEAPFDCAQAPELFMRLRGVNPASFGSLWRIAEETWIASSSPECLFDFDPTSRRIHSYPIKGTRPRGVDPAADEALAVALAKDPKDRAEHVMIVDLVRNDLGRVCDNGSVTVEELARVVSLPTVHHLISDVSGRLKANLDVAHVIEALFPGGSITGAPKIAAMKMIERVEGVRRGFYTGSLGMILPDGRATFNILIRTCVLHAGRLYYQTGGGIVADSTPEREWLETKDKARALTALLQAPSQA